MTDQDKVKPSFYWAVGLGLPVIGIITSIICFFISFGFMRSSSDVETSLFLFSIFAMISGLGLWFGFSSAKKKRIGISTILSTTIIIFAIVAAGNIWNNRILEGAKFNISLESAQVESVSISFITDTGRSGAINSLHTGIDKNGWFFVNEMDPGKYTLIVNASISNLKTIEYPSQLEVFPGKISEINIKIIGTS